MKDNVDSGQFTEFVCNGGTILHTRIALGTWDGNVWIESIDSCIAIIQYRSEKSLLIMLILKNSDSSVSLQFIQEIVEKYEFINKSDRVKNAYVWLKPVTLEQAKAIFNDLKVEVNFPS